MASAARSVWNWCVIGHILRFHLELTRVCVLAQVLSCDTGAGEPSWGRDGNGGTGMSQHRRRDEISHGAQRAHMGGSIRHAITARGLFALPLLLALALSSLVVVVAAPQPVVAAGTYFTADFNDLVDWREQPFGPFAEDRTLGPNVTAGDVVHDAIEQQQRRPYERRRLRDGFVLRRDHGRELCRWWRQSRVPRVRTGCPGIWPDGR